MDMALQGRAVVRYEGGSAVRKSSHAAIFSAGSCTRRALKVRPLARLMCVVVRGGHGQSYADRPLSPRPYAIRRPPVSVPRAHTEHDTQLAGISPVGAQQVRRSEKASVERESDVRTELPSNL